MDIGQVFNDINNKKNILNIIQQELIKQQINNYQNHEIIEIIDKVISPQVLSVHYQKGTFHNKTIDQVISFVNTTVIKEVIKYITIQKSKEKVVEEQSKNVINTNSKGVVNQMQPNKRESFLFALEDISTDVELHGVKRIELKSLSMYNKDYNVTEYNNKLVFREYLGSSNNETLPPTTDWYVVEIQPGDYTIEELIEELKIEMNTKSNCQLYNINVIKNSKQVAISIVTKTEDSEIKTVKNLRDLRAKIKNSETHTNSFGVVNRPCGPGIFEIDTNISTILPLLGFSNKQSKLNGNRQYISETSYCLVKKSLLQLRVRINGNEDLVEPIVLKAKNKSNNYQLSNTINFTEAKVIEKIELDFNYTSSSKGQGSNQTKYNHRNYPFNLIIKIN